MPPCISAVWQGGGWLVGCFLLCGVFFVSFVLGCFEKYWICRHFLKAEKIPSLWQHAKGSNGQVKCLVWGEGSALFSAISVYSLEQGALQPWARAELLCATCVHVGSSYLTFLGPRCQHRLPQWTDWLPLNSCRTGLVSFKNKTQHDLHRAKLLSLQP